jgi:hypothetical protein
MATRTFNPVLGKKIRLTLLDSCGTTPSSGDAGTVVVTDGFISLTLTAEVEDGAEIITKKASGALCVNEMTDSSFKRFTLEMEFCGVNPAALAFTTNAEMYEDWAGDVAGITVGEGTINKRFALELWTGLSGQACPTGVEEASGYLLLPFVNAGVMGDIEVTGEDAVTFSVTGAFTKGGNGWGTGPYDVVLNDGDPDALPEALDPLDHLLLIETGVAVPPSTDGAATFPG